MKYVLKNQEMQDVDKETIQQIGMPGLVRKNCPKAHGNGQKK